jgi:hypothetical protein
MVHIVSHFIMEICSFVQYFELKEEPLIAIETEQVVNEKS